LADRSALSGARPKLHITLAALCQAAGQGGQTLEQIDGAVEIDGQLYLVEAKWHKDPIGVQDVQVLLSRLFLRPGQPRGIFISANGFSPAAVNAQKEATSQRILLLCDLAQIVQVLEREESIGDFFKDKANRVITDLSSSPSAI